MTIRSTYALDGETSHNFKNLASIWHVSQAKVIRRLVQAAAERQEGRLDPAGVVARYRSGTLARNCEDTRAMIEALRRWRHADDEQRAAGHE